MEAKMTGVEVEVKLSLFKTAAFSACQTRKRARTSSVVACPPSPAAASRSPPFWAASRLHWPAGSMTSYRRPQVGSFRYATTGPLSSRFCRRVFLQSRKVSPRNGSQIAAQPFTQTAGPTGSSPRPTRQFHAWKWRDPRRSFGRPSRRVALCW
jgi:hypothetical protein